MNRKGKITAEQREELLAHYVEHGSVASAEKCAALGLSPRYASSLAASMGYRRPIWRAGNRYKDNSVDMPNASSRTRSNKDHRWEWAKQRGEVIA